MADPKNIADNAMKALRGNIREGMADRGKNATGNTSDRIAVLVSQGNGFFLSALEADSQWKYVGNGRGPGSMPPIANIQRWIDARGLSLNAYAVARKISLFGSRDFRLKRTNVFLDEIRAWEKNEVPKAEGAFADTLVDKALKEIDKVKFD